MIITATPEPLNVPPRIRLDFDSEGDEFLELSVMRDGRPIRQQPAVLGLSETFVYDYEAPFGVPVVYTAAGSTVSGWGSSFDETWASLSGWSTVEGTPSVSGGWLTGGTVTRSDVSIASVGRLVMAAGSTGEHGLRVGPVSIGGDATARRVFFLDGPASSVPATGLITIDWTATTATVTHSGGKTPLTTGSGAPAAAIQSWAGVRGPGFVMPGQLAGFTYSTPATTDPVSGSVSAILDIPAAYLIHPSQPSLSMPIERFVPGDDITVGASTDEVRTHPARQSIFQPNGRAEAVMFPLGPRGAGSWELTILTRTLAQRDALMTLLNDQAPLLLRSPASAGWDLPDGWYAVGDVGAARPVNVGDVALRRISLPLTRVAEPPVRVAPQLTWGDLMLRGFTWGDLLSYTWLDLLMGEV